MEHRMTDELVRIAAAGGGLRLNAGSRSTKDLLQIASAAASGGGQLFLTGMASRLDTDLLQIASAGRGRVVFEG